ncbi:hypothetical protein GH714_037260 [Hevea brasiliensis]|uniref:Uncharacterized protein n=1 Tax=Hevea brasiliensis TaxID=3981 RepID=A0A6A6L7N7_HEVBR|nr:hypothetical protein GH714_037260 [Hevea brasiliensis]
MLKKKYKLEKAKPRPSKWPFYYRLDSLIGAISTVNPKKKASAVTFTVKSKLRITPELLFRVSNSTEASFDDEKDEDDDDIEFDERTIKKQHRMEDVDFSDGAACRELASAILQFGEIYERIESSKQQQMVELEKQRMEFTKELEFERMNIFMDAQMELEKKSLKRLNPLLVQKPFHPSALELYCRGSCIGVEGACPSAILSMFRRFFNSFRVDFESCQWIYFDVKRLKKWRIIWDV